MTYVIYAGNSAMQVSNYVFRCKYKHFFQTRIFFNVNLLTEAGGECPAARSLPSGELNLHQTFPKFLQAVRSCHDHHVFL
jgi:hypothetical protein